MGRIHIVNLPDIGEGVVEGEVIEWLKNPGDGVNKDEPIVIVMTDKATVELPTPVPGKFIKAFYKAGEKAILGKPLYQIETDEEEVAAPKKEVSIEKKVEIPPTVAKKKEGKVLATPATRKIAKEVGVSINEVVGSGKEGRVVPKDFKTPQTNPLHLSDDREESLIGIPKLMAEKMAESKRTIPHFSYFEEVEVSRLIQLRENVRTKGESEGINVTFMPFFIRALSMTIEQFPILNSSVDMKHSKIIYHAHQNIGIAVNTKLGLIVPVLKDVQNDDLEQIIRHYNELKEKVKENKLSSHDMKEGTITLSNIGHLSGNNVWATPIINPPETAILALSKISKRTLVKEGKTVISDVLNLSWSFDHRVIDGVKALEISHYFATLLNNPASLT